MKQSEREQFEERRFRRIKEEIKSFLARDDCCPICLACNESLNKQWFWFFSESYGFGESVNQYIEHYGFCVQHTLQIKEIEQPWQTSAIYSWIIQNKLPELEKVLEALRKYSADNERKTKTSFVIGISRRNLKKFLQISKPKGSCIFCDFIRSTEEYQIDSLLRALDDEQVKQLYRKSFGLCMRHFFLVLERIDPEFISSAREIVELQISRLKELEIDFKEFFRKRDYRFKDELRGKEQTAWIRAIKRFIGE